MLTKKKKSLVTYIEKDWSWETDFWGNLFVNRMGIGTRSNKHRKDKFWRNEYPTKVRITIEELN